MPEAMPGPNRQRLGEALVECGLIDELQLRSALADQRRWGNRLGKTLVKLGFVDEMPLMRQLSRLMGYPVAEIRGRGVPDEVLALVSRDVAEKVRCLPLFVDEDGPSRYLYLGMEEPANLDALDALQMRTGLEICPVLIGFRELEAGLRRHYGIGVEGEPGFDYEDFELGGDLLGPDCLLHGDDAITLDAGADLPPPPEPPAAAPSAPAAQQANPAPPASAVPDSAHEDASTRRILQALTHVLIQKGLLTRDELQGMIQELDSRDRS